MKTKSEIIDDIMAEIPRCVCGKKFDMEAPIAFIYPEDKPILKMFACSKECIATWLENSKNAGSRVVAHISELFATH